VDAETDDVAAPSVHQQQHDENQGGLSINQRVKTPAGTNASVRCGTVECAQAEQFLIKCGEY
jgi:hypothetical protein